MTFLSIPEDVIWEMSHDTHDEYPTGRSSYSDQRTSCLKCGYHDLRWKNVDGRWELVYASGELKGKLHGCW